jgi:hypothetical protein
MVTRWQGPSCRVGHENVVAPARPVACIGGHPLPTEGYAKRCIDLSRRNGAVLSLSDGFWQGLNTRSQKTRLSSSTLRATPHQRGLLRCVLRVWRSCHNAPRPYL